MLQELIFCFYSLKSMKGTPQKSLATSKRVWVKYDLNVKTNSFLIIFYSLNWLLSLWARDEVTVKLH